MGRGGMRSQRPRDGMRAHRRGHRRRMRGHRRGHRRRMRAHRRGHRRRMRAHRRRRGRGIRGRRMAGRHRIRGGVVRGGMGRGRGVRTRRVRRRGHVGWRRRRVRRGVAGRIGIRIRGICARRHRRGPWRRRPTRRRRPARHRPRWRSPRPPCGPRVRRHLGRNRGWRLLASLTFRHLQALEGSVDLGISGAELVVERRVRAGRLRLLAGAFRIGLLDPCGDRGSPAITAFGRHQELGSLTAWPSISVGGGLFTILVPAGRSSRSS